MFKNINIGEFDRKQASLVGKKPIVRGNSRDNKNSNKSYCSVFTFELLSSQPVTSSNHQPSNEDKLVDEAFGFLDNEKDDSKKRIIFPPIQVPANQAPSFGPGSALSEVPDLKPPTRRNRPPLPLRSSEIPPPPPTRSSEIPPPPPTRSSEIELPAPPSWPAPVAPPWKQSSKAPSSPPPWPAPVAPPWKQASKATSSPPPTRSSETPPPLSPSECRKPSRKKMFGCLPIPSCFGGHKSKKVKITSRKDAAMTRPKDESLADILMKKDQGKRVIKRTKF